MAKRNERRPHPSDAQLEVLNIIWERGEATVGEVWQAIAAGRPVARNTILTLMARLEEKGWLRRSADGNILRYSAAVPQETALRQITRRLVDTAFQGSAEGLVMTLLDSGDLSEGESARIRAMLDAIRREKKGEEQMMASLLKFYPGDAVVMLAANVLVQIAAVVALAWATSLGFARHRAAMRHGIWLAAFGCVLLSPMVAYIAARSGLSLIALPLLPGHAVAQLSENLPYPIELSQKLPSPFGREATTKLPLSLWERGLG